MRCSRRKSKKSAAASWAEGGCGIRAWVQKRALSVVLNPEPGSEPALSGERVRKGSCFRLKPKHADVEGRFFEISAPLPRLRRSRAQYTQIGWAVRIRHGTNGCAGRLYPLRLEVSSLSLQLPA